MELMEHAPCILVELTSIIINRYPAHPSALPPMSLLLVGTVVAPSSGKEVRAGAAPPPPRLACLGRGPAAVRELRPDIRRRQRFPPGT